MVKERRVLNNYPESLRTRQNNRETFVADDPLFEPEQANFLNGFIGDVSVLSDEDLARTPRILEMDAERQKYQLSVGATFIDPDSQVRISAAFYTDMIRQIEANGGDTTDPNRVFATDFYAWTPPIDYDKHINFGRYRWIGPGSADVQGEYITIEPSHSKTALYEWDGATMTMREVKVVDGLPAVEPDGTFVEDASTNERFIYRSNGVVWVLLDLDMVDDVPAGSPALDIPTYFYVARTGPDFNRPLVWRYSDAAGRWIPTPVIVNREPPETIRDGMVWEDIRIGSERTLKVALNGAFSDLTYTRAPGPPGTPGTDGEYLYDTRNFSDLPAGCWEANNWWRHHEDLSPVDASRAGEDQATRPIIEFWNGLEQIAGDVRDARNDLPVFKKFAFDLTPDEVVDTGEGTTIFQYQVGTGQDDFVLGFPLVFNDTGEFLFDLTLETDTSAFIGYKYFKDTNTGFLHGIWFKSDVLTNQAVDSDGQYDIPVGISSNPDHEVLTNPSRSRMLRHMTEIMKAQPTFAGSEFGLNSYRWTRRNPTLGATIIDAEQTHLRTLATLQSSALDTPNAIRSMAKEYNKVLFRFTNRMNQLWDNLQINTGSGTLTVTATDAVDAILTSLFIGRTSDFPFNQSDMGTYLETLIAGGIATIVDTTPKPIFIAPSPTRVGAAPCFTPSSFEERDGTTVLRGHEGTIIPSFGDERDLIWLELQERFFAAVPTRKCEETDTFSARFSGSNFFLQDFYGNFTPQTQTESVDEVVTDFNAVVGPADGLRVFSAAQGVFAVFSAGQWLTRDSLTDEIFLNNDDGEFYIFNGKSVNLIDRFERPVAFDYSWNEFREIIRRDFERFIIFREQDFSENTTFVAADPFTWNFRSAGVEGHYLGIYRRVYNTVRPQSHPWEVMGYAIEPTWWRTSYVPDSTAPDGTPRYGSAHPMWADFATGTVAHPSGAITNPAFTLTAPVPVDAVGELLDPIAAGVVDEGKLDKERIDDIWVYGDGAPEEQEFLNSNFFPFSVSLAGYLMKNGIWMDTLWSEIYISIGTEGTNKLFRAPHVVHETTLTRPAISTLPVHLERDASGDPIKRIGVVAWISEFVNVNGGDPTTDFGRIVRNTSAALTWKASGFINQNRTIISTLSRNEIPFTDVHVLLHNSQPLTSTFCSGVLITRESPNGFRVFGFDPFDPFFTIERPAVPIVGGQVVLTEEFTVEFTDDNESNITGGTVFPNKTLQRTFIVTEFGLPRSGTALDTAQLSVIINGLRIKPQFIKVDPNANTVTVDEVVQLEEGDEVSVQIVTTQSNPSTQVRQFVVNDVAFPYFVEGSGEFDRIEYGRFFETSTEVIQFMIGYGRFLTQQGWVFDGLSEGGSTRDWLLGAQRFARWVLEVETPWNPNPQLDPIDEDLFLYSPIQDAAKFRSEFGQGTNIESIMNGAFGILNQRSEPIEVDETVVSRIDDTVTIERVDGTNTESAIFGARVNLIEAEHVVILSNITRFNDIIYDPVSGLSQRTLIVDSYRTLNWEGRAEANGYVINGGELLPNFEKQAFDFTRFYDRFNTIDDPVRREQARNLYGFVPANQSRFGDPSKSIRRRQTSDSSQYMIPAGAADRSRFDYARGMMQAQGTRRPVFAFTRGTTISRDNFFLSEDWAWKLGPTYGDTRRRTVQISVDTADFRDDIQVVQFGGPIVVTNNTIEVLDFNRNDLTADGDRWILPPAQCKFQSTCNLEFPINRDTGLIDVATHRHYAKLFDLETGNTVIDHVHYDPEIDRFDTVARCQIEFENPLDPARYNVIPAKPETTYFDFINVNGGTLSIGGSGDFFDISSTTNRYRFWFNVVSFEVTDVAIPAASSFTLGTSLAVAGSSWRFNTAPGDVGNHVWYSVERSEVSSIKFTNVTGADFTPSSSGDFFTLGVVGGFYHAWFDVDDANTDPNPPGSLGGIRVRVGPTFTDHEVARAIATTLSGFQGGIVFSTDTLQPGDETVVVTNVVPGAVDDIGTSVVPTVPLGLIVSQNETNYDGTGVNGTFVGGDGPGGTAYVAAETITLSDGSVITVDAVDIDGDVTDFTVTSVTNTNVPIGGVLTQTSTSGTGVGFSLTVNFANVDMAFEVTTQGASNIDPAVTANGHMVVVGVGDSAEDVAIATEQVLLSSPSLLTDIQVTRVGSTLTLTNINPGLATNAADIDAGVIVTITTDASTPPNVAPADGGNVLIEIQVPATATNIQIADAVTASLISTDSDFSSALNGASTVVRVSLTTPGKIMDAAIGVFPTPPIIRVRSGSDSSVNENCWGEEQVGCLWWNPSRKKFIDYRRLIPEYEDMAAVWGKPLFYKSIISRTDDIATAVLYQFDDLDRVGTPANLADEQGLSNGDEVLITIRKANQSGYNLVNITATVTSATTGEIEFEVSASPDTPATGDPEVVFGHIDIYEWVESPVEPQEWETFVAGLDDPTHPNGTPLNVDDPSFVQLTRRLSDGRTEVIYYFWVLNSVGINRKNARPIEGDIGKELTAFEISQRLSNPTARGIAWFAPVDIDHMLIHTDGEQVLDDYGFEILIDQRFRQTHHEFILVSEGNRFLEIPDQIVEKMIDSLSGQDAKLNTVPSPLLEETERFGACFFPIQTVFANREQAVSLYTVAVNRILARRNLTGLQGLTSIFRLSEEFDEVTNPTGFWQRSAFMNETVQGLSILETVTTVAEMNRRLGEGLYAEGDLVRVLTSDFVDAWDGSPVSATYQLLDTGGFLAVSIDNQTASINTNIDDDPVRFREMYFLIYNSIFQDRIEQNELIFSLFHEIKIQHPDPKCDWLFKTSYITTQVFTSIDNSPFVRPDEVTAIRDNLLSTKPYRTKLRGEINTVGGIEEDVNVNLQEFPDKKIALILDRLSCNTLDDCGWDTFAWDTRDLPCDRWDTALWDFEDLGREEFYLVETIQANDTDTVYEATPIFDPTLYEVKVEVKLNGVIQQSLSDSTVITKTHNKITVDTVFGLSTQFTIDVLQAQGFYQGDDPNFIGTTIEDTLFQPVPSDYKHAIARRPDTPLIGCDDPNDPLGGRPEERIVTEVCDSVNICVINDYSESLKGWDATPWDVNPWDQGPPDVGRRVFIVSVGKQLETPPGPEVFPTSEDITVVDPFAIIGTNPFTFKIVQIEQQVSGVGPFNIITEGVEFEFLGIFNNAIKSKVPDNQEFVTDGVAQQFQTTAGTQVTKVFLDGLLQTEGPDYSLDGTRTLITFNFLPAPARKIEVEFEPYIQPTDIVRYRFNCWPVGMLGTFTVSPLAGALTGLTYDVIRGEFKFDTSPPPPNEFFTLQYTVPRKNGLPESILVRMPEIVADILDDHESYDDPNGFNEFRPVGTRIINTTSNMVFEWDGAIWNAEPPVAPGTQFFVTRKQQIWEFDGLAFNLLFSVGDPFTKPPVLDYPLFGRGITFGTYAFGQHPNANVEYPDAFQIIQHPGDCPP